MDDRQFDHWTLAFAQRASRRQFARRGLRVLAAIGPALAPSLDAGAKKTGGRKKRCQRNQDKCRGHKCARSCPAWSSSVCCYGAYPTCCPTGVFPNRLCCPANHTCCPPIPEEPTGYCCDPGSTCSDTGCVLERSRSGLGGEGTAVTPNAPGNLR